MSEKKKGANIVSTDSKVDGWMLPAAETEALLSSEGKPIPAEQRAELERELRMDLSGVKVHQGENAFRITRVTGAKAFTLGNHVFLNTESYNPIDKNGKHLLAHELTHAVQQGGSLKEIDSEPATKQKKITKITDLYK